MRTLFFVFLFTTCLVTIHAQESNDNSDDKTSWSLYLLTSAHLESTNSPEKDTWSKIGIGGGMYHRYNSGVGINARVSFRAWDRFGFDKRVIPISIGPSYEFNKDSDISFSIYAGAGPALIMGNDYAGFFGSFDIGLEAYFPAWDNNEIFIRTAFAQGMTFNSGFNYLDFAVGLRL